MPGYFATDGTCTSAGDPARSRNSPPENAFPRGSYAGLWFYAPAGTYDLRLRACGQSLLVRPGAVSGQPIEQTYTATSYGDAASARRLGVGQWRSRPKRSRSRRLPLVRVAGAGHQFGAADTASSRSPGDSANVLAAFASCAAGRRIMTISSGCYADDGSADCTLGPGAGEPTRTSTGRASRSATRAQPGRSWARPPGQGLRASGTRSGSEPVTFSASDNVGIRKAELVDVTDAANPDGRRCPRTTTAGRSPRRRHAATSPGRFHARTSAARRSRPTRRSPGIAPSSSG